MGRAPRVQSPGFGALLKDPLELMAGANFMTFQHQKEASDLLLRSRKEGGVKELVSLVTNKRLGC